MKSQGCAGHPFALVIRRAEFIRAFRAGDCSFLLLRVILTTASRHAPANVLSSCGFANRTDAQEQLFHRTRLLYDLAAGDDPLILLQASIILSMVILNHPTDRDFGYWFHTAISLATKLDLQAVSVFCQNVISLINVASTDTLSLSQAFLARRSLTKT